MNRFISLLLIVVALASSSVQGFAPSSLGGVSGGEFPVTGGLPAPFAVYGIVLDCRLDLDGILPNRTELNTL
jgi:hypothetical protein